MYYVCVSMGALIFLAFATGMQMMIGGDWLLTAFLILCGVLASASVYASINNYMDGDE